MEKNRRKIAEYGGNQQPTRGKRHLGLQGKMSCGLLGALAVVLLLTGAVLLRQARAEFVRLTELNIAEQTRSIQMETETYFTRFLDALQMAAGMDRLNALAVEAEEKGADFRFEESPVFAGASQDLQNAMAQFPDGVQNIFFACAPNNQLIRGNGTGTEPGYVLDEEPWWQLLLENHGMPCVTAAYESVFTNGLVVTAVVPVYCGTRIVGAMAADIALAQLTDVIQEMKVGRSGYVVLCDSAGQIVYHPDPDCILATLEAAGFSREIQEAVGTRQDASAVVFRQNGEVIHGTALQIPSLDWKVIGCMPNEEFNSEVMRFAGTILLCFLLTAVLLGLVASFSIQRMVRPIRSLVKVSERLSQGELDVEVDTRGQDEIGDLARSTAHIVERLKTYIAYIDELAEVLRQMGRRDLVFALKQDYVGEFGKLKTAMDEIQHSLTDVLYSMLNASERADNSSAQMASGAQALAQGATEQAGTVQELASLVQTLSEQSVRESNHADEVNQEVQRIGEKVQTSNAQMQNLLRAMEQIQAESVEIGKIVKSVEDIAFQTNILALNAAVESARAGAAGKGFAVVADEVRSLAGKSAESAGHISQLIQDSMAAVKNGVGLAVSTASALEEVAEEMGGVVSSIDGISGAYRDAARQLGEINAGIDSVSAVVQSNSATAEESAAAAEELAGQVDVMKQLVDTFRLDETDREQR